MNKHFENGVIKSEPKKWTKKEIEILLDYKKNNVSFEEIGSLLKRTSYSCNKKYYKLMKKLDKYNVKHRAEKYRTNAEFLSKVEATTILDVFSGGVSWYKKNTDYQVIDNDLYVDGADYKMDAIDFLFSQRKNKFDIVDLDPFGSAFECFDFALQIAQKGLIITFGEIVGRRFNRMDFVEYRYGMNYIEDFTTKKLCEYVIGRGLIFRKKLTPTIISELTNISRVYFSIEHFDYGKSGCKYFPKKDIPNLFSNQLTFN
jgi:hypothetical protein